MTVTEDSTQSLQRKNYNNNCTNLYRLHYLRHYTVSLTESAIFLPVPYRDWNPSKHFCPSDTHWNEYGLRILYYCILHWGRPVSKSRQIEPSHIARNFEPTCAAFDTWQSIKRHQISWKARQWDEQYLIKPWKHALLKTFSEQQKKGEENTLLSTDSVRCISQF